MMTECKYCKKTFNHSGHLTRHIRTHTREKPYECSYCKKRFSDSSTLTVHTRIHTGERPFCCKFCKKTFSRSDSLRVHVRTHTGEKKFECNHCRKTFSRSGNLTVHMRTHSTLHTNNNNNNNSCTSIHNGNSIDCSGCSKTFNQSNDVNCLLKTQHHHRDTDNPIFPSLCKTEDVDVYLKPSCCSGHYQQPPFPSTAAAFCCKRVSSGSLSLNHDQCNNEIKLNGYFANQSMEKSCNSGANQSLEIKPEPSFSAANIHCNLTSSSGHYTQLVLQNDKKTFDNLDKSLSHTCQLRHFQKSFDSVDTLVSTPSAYDNHNVVYVNRTVQGAAPDKAAQCGLCDKSVLHMCQLNGGNYYMPFSNTFNSLTNVTNIPTVSVCSTADISRNQSHHYTSPSLLSSQQTFPCEHCKNSSHTNGLTGSKCPSVNNEVLLKPDLSSSSRDDHHSHSSCALISNKSHYGQLKYGCENCKTSTNIKSEKNVLGVTNSFNGQNDSLKKSSQNISLSSTKNESCSYNGNTKLLSKDQMFACKQCDVSSKDECGASFGQQADTKPSVPLTVNYNNQLELDIKPNLSMCPPLEPNMQPSSYYNNIKNHTTDKQLSCMKSFASNALDIKSDPTGSNSFFGLLQSLPETSLLECDNYADPPYVQYNGFFATQNSSQKSCLLSSRLSNNSETMDIKPNISSIHESYHQALSHFSQADTFSKSDFSSCFNSNLSSLESNFYEPVVGDATATITNSNTALATASGTSVKSEPPFFCPSSETQSQPFSYHNYDQADIKPDLSLFWF
ncbi:zinc finger protein 62 homolog [Argonauta hians]